MEMIEKANKGADPSEIRECPRGMYFMGLSYGIFMGTCGNVARLDLIAG